MKALTNRFTLIFGVAFVAALLSSPQTMAEESPSSPINVSGGILGYSLTSKGLTLQVESGGCLSKDNFEVRQLETFPIQISIVQVSIDFCEAYLPFGTSISYTYAELGLRSGDLASVSVKSKASPVRVP